MSATASGTADRAAAEAARSGQTALAAGCLAVVAWGLGPLIVRGISASTPTIVLYRMVLGVPVMYLAARLFGAPITWQTFRRALVPGVLFGTSLVTSFASIRTTSIANATLIAALVPAVMLLGAGRLVGEPPRRDKVPFAVVSMVGLAVMVLSGSSTSGATLRGDLLAVATLVIFTGYFLSVKRVRNAGVESWSLLAAIFVVATVVVTPWCLLTSHDLGAVGGTDWLLLALMVLGPGVVGHGLMTWAQRQLTVTTSSLLTLASPVVSTLGAWLLYDQRLTLLQLAGAATVLGGLAGLVVDGRRQVLRVPTLEP